MLISKVSNLAPDTGVERSFSALKQDILGLIASCFKRDRHGRKLSTGRQPREHDAGVEFNSKELQVSQAVLFRKGTMRGCNCLIVRLDPSVCCLISPSLTLIL